MLEPAKFFLGKNRNGFIRNSLLNLKGYNFDCKFSTTRSIYPIDPYSDRISYACRKFEDLSIIYRDIIHVGGVNEMKI